MSEDELIIHDFYSYPCFSKLIRGVLGILNELPDPSYPRVFILSYIVEILCLALSLDYWYYRKA